MATEKGYTVILKSTPTQIIRAVFKDSTVQIQTFALVADIELSWRDTQELGTLAQGITGDQIDQLIDADALHALVYPESGSNGDRPSSRMAKRHAKKED